MREKRAPETRRCRSDETRTADERDPLEASVRGGWRESSKRSSASVGAGGPFRGKPRVPCRAGGRLLSRLHRRGVAAPDCCSHAPPAARDVCAAPLAPGHRREGGQALDRSAAPDALPLKAALLHLDTHFELHRLSHGPGDADVLCQVRSRNRQFVCPPRCGELRRRVPGSKAAASLVSAINALALLLVQSPTERGPSAPARLSESAVRPPLSPVNPSASSFRLSGSLLGIRGDSGAALIGRSCLRCVIWVGPSPPKTPGCNAPARGIRGSRVVHRFRRRDAGSGQPAPDHPIRSGLARAAAGRRCPRHTPRCDSGRDVFGWLGLLS